MCLLPVFEPANGPFQSLVPVCLAAAVNRFPNGRKIRLFVMAVTSVRTLKLTSCSTSRPGPKDSVFESLDELHPAGRWRAIRTQLERNCRGQGGTRRKARLAAPDRTSDNGNRHTFPRVVFQHLARDTALRRDCRLAPVVMGLRSLPRWSVEVAWDSGVLAHVRFRFAIQA